MIEPLEFVTPPWVVNAPVVVLGVATVVVNIMADEEEEKVEEEVNEEESVFKVVFVEEDG